MIKRELRIKNENGATYAIFIKYIQGQGKEVKKLITNKEAERGQAAIKSNDQYIIDNFCYSIS